jgi:low affinity Fe/Cu permease
VAIAEQADPTLKRWFEGFSTASARFAGQPAMLVLVVALCMVGVVAFISDDEHFLGGASLAISMVTLVLIPILQATQNRDNAALHAKIDELIKTHEGARDSLIGVEKQSTDEIEKVRLSEERSA